MLIEKMSMNGLKKKELRKIAEEFKTAVMIDKLKGEFHFHVGLGANSYRLLFIKYEEHTDEIVNYLSARGIIHKYKKDNKGGAYFSINKGVYVK